jgi:hypothetical protein
MDLETRSIGAGSGTLKELWLLRGKKDVGFHIKCHRRLLKGRWRRGRGLEERGGYVAVSMLSEGNPKFSCNT